MKSIFALGISASTLSALLFACTTTTSLKSNGSTSTNGGSNGSGSVSGTENGVAVDASNPFAGFGTVTQTVAGTTPTTTYLASVALTSRSDLSCGIFSDAFQTQSTQVEFKNLSALSFSVASLSPLATTTYTIVAQTSGASDPSIDATFAQTDSACNSLSSETANSGTVTFNELDSTSLTGTFDLSFPSGAHLTGSFDSTPCPLDVTLNDTSTGNDSDDAGTTVTCE